MTVRLPYLIALFVIAAMVTISAFVMTYIFNAQKEDAKIINTAGEQRMLSQRIALAQSFLIGCPDDVEQHKQRLSNATTQFKQNHALLSTLDNLPKSIYEIYFGTTALDDKVKALIAKADLLLAINECDSAQLALKMSDIDEILVLLDKVVGEFEKEAVLRVERIKTLELILWLTTLLILVLEGLFIFRPMDNKIKQSFAKIESAKQIAVDANKAKSEFLASMSHELRTPMNGLFGMIDLAIDNPKKSDEYLKKAKVAGRQLLALINDVLDLSKIEAGKLQVQRVSFDLFQLIDDAVSLQSIYCKKKGLRFEYKRLTSLPRRVYGDPIRVNQILNNLMNNAVKFTEHGTITFEVSCTIEGQGHMLCIGVTDTGVGIEDALHDTIFDQFEQVDQSNTRQFGGTGLGLSISNKLASLMDGRLSVSSKLGKGSTFTLNMPIEIDTRDYKLTDVPIKLKCAIVDDLQTSREFLQYLAEQQGFEVQCFENANAFLSAFDSNFDVLLLDLSMPNIDGISTIRHLLEAKAKRIPYIIVISAVLEHLQYDEEIRKHVWRTHAKPLVREELEADLLDLQKIYLNQEENTDKSAQKNKHILVVEDNELNAEIVQLMLEGSGFEVSTVGNGKRAVDAVILYDYDLLLMDLEMPIMNGFEATQVIRETHQLDIPIIALTANAFEEDRKRCEELGMNDFVSKPTDRIRLIKAIENCLKNR